MGKSTGKIIHVIILLISVVFIITVWSLITSDSNNKFNFDNTNGLISSKQIGLANNTSEGKYHESETEHRVEELPKRSRAIMWIRLGSPGKDHNRYDIVTFANMELDKLEREVVIITSDGDTTVPDDLPQDVVDRILDHPKILAWYSQNYNSLSFKHPKLRHYPIGLDLHTVRPPFKSIREMSDTYMAMHKKISMAIIYRIWSDTHLTGRNRFGNPREMIANRIGEAKLVDAPKSKLTQIEVWRKYHEYQFVMSVSGNGLDCHRTWEALGLGAVVLTFHTGLDPLLKQFRVVFMDWNKWLEQVNDKNWLAMKYEEAIKNPVPNMTHDYWINKVCEENNIASDYPKKNN